MRLVAVEEQGIDRTELTSWLWVLLVEASRSALHTGPALDRIRMLFADVLLIRYHLAGTIFSSRPICLLGFPDSVFFLPYRSPHFIALYI